MGFFMPPHQFAAFLAGVGLGLLCNPCLCSNLRNFSEILYHILVMANSIDDMHLTELFHPLAWKLSAFIARVTPCSFAQLLKPTEQATQSPLNLSERQP